MFKLGLLLTRFRHELRLVWAMLRDARTPLAAKLTAVLALLYVLSPVDLIPDVLPILGWLDDGLVAYWLFKLAQHLLPADLLAALKKRAEGEKNGRAEKADFEAK
jgi:uncharacterized membrane protein YkvA (DUF1232 family)